MFHLSWKDLTASQILKTGKEASIPLTQEILMESFITMNMKVRIMMETTRECGSGTERLLLPITGMSDWQESI